MRKSNKIITKNLKSAKANKLSEKTETISTKMALINDITNVFSEESGIDIYFYTSEEKSTSTDELFVVKKIPDYLFDAPISKISFGYLKMNIEIRGIDKQVIQYIHEAWILENSSIPNLKSVISSIQTNLDKLTDLYKSSGMTRMDYDKFMTQLKETGIIKTQTDYSEILKLRASLKDYNKEKNNILI